MINIVQYYKNRRFGRELIKFFDRIYCINLDSRPDRWSYIGEHFSKYGLAGGVRRFSAIDVRSRPEYRVYDRLLQDNFSRLAMCGCLLSHRAVIESARAEKLNNILIFEDDVKIIEDNICEIRRSLMSLSECDWDVFYLGATYLWRLEAYNTYLVRVPNGAYATHAIAYNHSIYDKLLDVLPASPEDYFDTDRFDVSALDKWLQSELFDHTKFYGANPIMVVQALQESDIAMNQQDAIERRQIELFYKNLDAN